MTHFEQRAYDTLRTTVEDLEKPDEAFGLISYNSKRNLQSF